MFVSESARGIASNSWLEPKNSKPTKLALGMAPFLAFTADSRQTEAVYKSTTLLQRGRDEGPLQKAIDDADYEHGHRKNELDFLTAFRSPVTVARK